MNNYEEHDEIIAAVHQSKVWQTFHLVITLCEFPGNVFAIVEFNQR